MSTIRISAQILDGNLSAAEGFEAATARALAEFQVGVWQRDAARFCEAGHTIVIDIDVREHACGSARVASVDVTECSCGDRRRPNCLMLEAEVAAALTHEAEIWEQFCGRPELWPVATTTSKGKTDAQRKDQ